MEHNEFLKLGLAVSVPLDILELKAKGGPNLDDWNKCINFAQTLAEKGDLLMFRSKREGETAELYTQLSHSIAVMSFSPGGVRFLDEHWESEIEVDSDVV